MVPRPSSRHRWAIPDRLVLPSTIVLDNHGQSSTAISSQPMGVESYRHPPCATTSFTQRIAVQSCRVNRREIGGQLAEPGGQRRPTTIGASEIVAMPVRGNSVSSSALLVFAFRRLLDHHDASALDRIPRTSSRISVAGIVKRDPPVTRAIRHAIALVESAPR